MSTGEDAHTGWAVITNSETRELDGTDALYFNFFYSGEQATALIRFLDNDGEYWQYRIQISNNSKQTIVAKYEDFVLRTAGTNVYDREFGYKRISYFEVVFEETYGDGVCLLGNVRAVRFENYSYLFKI